MKKRAITFAICLLALLSAPPLAAESGGLRYTITVTEFENRAGWHGHWDIGNAWGTVLTDLLNQSGRFIVLGESDMRGAALDEQDFVASGRTAQGRKAPVTGQMTPAQILTKGAITHVQHDTAARDACAGEALCDCLRARAGRGCANDRGAGAAERVGNGRADATRRTRHQRNLAG